MILPELRLVIPDGSGKLPITADTIEWYEYSDVYLPVRVVHASGAPYDLSGNVFAAIGFKYRETDDEPFLQVAWSITNYNTAVFSFPKTEVLLKARSYVASIQFNDDDTGFEDTILGQSRVIVKPRTATFTLVAPPSPPLYGTYDCIPGVTLNDLVYISAANTVDKFDASNPATAPALGFVSQMFSSTSCQIQMSGQLNGFSGLTAGQVQYGDTTPGGITDDVTGFATPCINQKVAEAKNATTIEIKLGSAEFVKRN